MNYPKGEALYYISQDFSNRFISRSNAQNFINLHIVLHLVTHRSFLCLVVHRAKGERNILYFFTFTLSVLSIPQNPKIFYLIPDLLLRSAISSVDNKIW